MAIGVKRHLDRAMPHEGLYLLRVVALLDPQRGARVAQGVQAIFGNGDQDRRTSVVLGLFLSRHAGRDLDRSEATIDQVGIGLDFANPVWKNEIKIALRQASFHSRSAFRTMGGIRSIR